VAGGASAGENGGEKVSEPGKAIFLSYASQDAAAAKRIADALRAAGVEVWFDAEGGLEHGDEWDAKIRRQIKECVLFIPVISANTQAREEGYFRIEWDLAAERARGIASGVAFILPVVIDETKEPAALVPDRFRTVQWTRLPGGVVSPEILQRFLKLWSHRTGTLKHAAADTAGTIEVAAPPAPAKRRAIWPWVALGLVAIAAAYLIFKPRRSPEEITRIVADAQKLTAAVTPPFQGVSNGSVPAAEFPADPDLAKAIKLVETLNSTMEDHTLAEDLAKGVLARKPTDPETVIVNAYVANRFILRGFDVSEERHAAARRLCERALLLAPDHPEALHVMGQFLGFRGADLPRAVDLLRRAVTLQPNRARFYNSYIEALENNNDPDVVRIAEAAAARFPTDPIIRYRLALVYAYGPGDLDAYERALDETIAIGPVATAVLRKVGVTLLVHRDIAAAQRLLDQVPESFRLNDRTVYARYLVASASGEVDDALRALNALPGNFLSDFGLWPKRMLTGDLLARKGQADLARRDYEAALADIARERARNPNVGFERQEKWLLLWLGREKEARASANLTYEAVRRPVALRGLTNMWFVATSTLLVLGERAKALELLREGAADDWGRRVLAGAFALDPHLAPWRGDKEIMALLAKPDTPTAPPAVPAAKVDERSVAVLAFANLSDDKANEYFSDGISEELLNVLAKVPQLKVAARTSSFYFKGQNVPIPEIAQKLGVAYVVEGSVRKAGSKVRITAQLIKAADGFHVWSETYDRDLTDIFAVQDEIAKNILGVVRGSLMGEAELPHATTTKIEAYTFFLQAQGAFAKRGEANLRESIRLFEAALAIDPDYVPALVGLAQARVVLPNYAYLSGAKAREITDGAMQAARRALALDPQNAAAHAVIGWELFQFEWRWSEGLAEVLRARDLAPNDPWNWNCLGDYYRYVGDYPQALSAKQREWELDPLSPNSHWDLSYSNLVGGNYDQAIHWSEICVGLAPHNVDSYMPAILAAGRAGRLDLMRRTLAAARQNIHEGEGMLLLLGAYCAILEKKPDEAHRLLTQAVPLAEGASASPSYLGYCYLLLGEADQARIWLQRGYDRYDEAMVWNEIIDFDVIAANPKTRPILDQPKLKELYELRQRNARAGLNKL
jgi:TolB-like protein/Tfp pilus assembly protein PilF